LNKSSSKAGSNLSSDEKKGLKKAAELEKAKELYLDMNGEISNTDLSKAVGVTPVTIAKWKKDYDWPGLLESVEEAPAFTEQPSFVTQRVIDYEEEDFEDEEIPFELEKLDDMLAPEQISNMNRKIATLLERDHLSAEELAQLAEAKADLLEGVQTYLNILQDITNFQF
jgi:DNA-binding XRE family transcriptional regulator